MLRIRAVVLAAAIASTLIGGCASKTTEKPISQPETVAAKPATAPPAAKPEAPPAPPAKPAVAAAPKPAPKTTGKAVPLAAGRPAPTAPAVKPAAPRVAAPAAPAKLDLNALKEQLKATKAIGVFTKISLKNQVDDLMQQFRDYYQGKSKLTMADLRRSYNLLMMKVLTLLQDEDKPLASSIVSSREAIWSLLANPTTFATLQS